MKRGREKKGMIGFLDFEKYFMIRWNFNVPLDKKLGHSSSKHLQDTVKKNKANNN